MTMDTDPIGFEGLSLDEKYPPPSPTEGTEVEEEEGVTVAIRLRPLHENRPVDDDDNYITSNENRSTGKPRIWKMLENSSSVTQTTIAGMPLKARIPGRTFFTFDKIFGETATTFQIYDSVVRGIVSSVVEGKHGTIFAYGQTASGKTYTMQGSSSIKDGSLQHSSGGGLVHMAAREIFALTRSLSHEREFQIKVSFLEIYNEKLHDLLSDNPKNDKLRIREDRKRGVFVQNLEEYIVADSQSLLQYLMKGEESRAVAATAMNQRSSRSHSIFQITIESRPVDMDDDNDYEGNVETVSTLNLVDLAGSENARHSRATGNRRKEGGMINQSLLALSRVIVGLGSPNKKHINYRDSKLTRILQPWLSGNSKVAVICCATPSEAEETRSTLKFASRAKLVKTNAKVNVVTHEDPSVAIIRRLKRELAEARRDRNSDAQSIDSSNSEEYAAVVAAKKAEEQLQRLKASILSYGNLFGGNNHDNAMPSPHLHLIDTSPEKLMRRNLSDSDLAGRDATTPAPKINTRPEREYFSPTTRNHLSPSRELDLVREAYSTKIGQMRTLKDTVEEQNQLLEMKASELAATNSLQQSLVQARDEAQQRAEQQAAMIAFLQTELDSAIASQQAAMAEKDATLENALATIEKEVNERQKLQAMLQNMEEQHEMEKELLEGRIRELNYDNENASEMMDDVFMKVAALTDDTSLLIENGHGPSSSSDYQSYSDNPELSDDKKDEANNGVLTQKLATLQSVISSQTYQMGVLNELRRQEEMAMKEQNEIKDKMKKQKHQQLVHGLQEMLERKDAELEELTRRHEREVSALKAFNRELRQRLLHLSADMDSWMTYCSL